jgi:hypothetical protein
MKIEKKLRRRRAARQYFKAKLNLYWIREELTEGEYIELLAIVRDLKRRWKEFL